jgi:hypothetical protein
MVSPPGEWPWRMVKYRGVVPSTVPLPFDAPLAMRNLLFIIASFGLTIFCWGVYGPVLHWGQADMATTVGQYARLKPFVCVGLAYFLIGVVIPIIWLVTRGEKGHWTTSGTVLSLAAGVLGAVGALGIILAFNSGGRPVYVMPLVFGGAPVVNAFLTIYLVHKLKEIGPLFLAGLIMVALGAVIVLVFAPTVNSGAWTGDPVKWAIQLASIALVIVCWGSYGPILHKGQASMQQSRLRPLLCVGLAYFAIAVVVPNMLLSIWPEESSYTMTGSFWSLTAGAAGAVGALGVILTFNLGGKPIYVMPLIFGGAPVVNTIFSAAARGDLHHLHPMFLAGLILVIAGAAVVLVFAPRGGPPSKTKTKTEPVVPPKEPAANQ